MKQSNMSGSLCWLLMTIQPYIQYDDHQSCKLWLKSPSGSHNKVMLIPLTTTFTHPKTMCTIIIKVFKNVLAIPACPASSYLNPQAMNISSCINTVSGLQSIYRLAQTYASVMPAWITNTFFNPEFEIHRITTHNYCDHESVQTMRQMDNVHLVDFVELQLKSRDDFGAAYDIILSTKLSDYMKLYLLLQPGDWPAQFYSR